MPFTFINANLVKSNLATGHVTSVAVPLTGVSAGNILRVSFGGFNGADRAMVSDSAGSIYTPVGFALDSAVPGRSDGEFLGEWWGIAAASGTVTVTIKPGPGYPPLGFDLVGAVCQIAYDAGQTVAATTAVLMFGEGILTYSGGANDCTTGPISFPEGAATVLCGTFVTASEGGSWVAGTGFALRASSGTDGSMGGHNLAVVDMISSTSTSPEIASANFTTADPVPWIGLGYAFYYTQTGLRDRDVRNAIVSALMGSNAFDGAFVSGLPEHYGFGTKSAVAVVEPVSSSVEDLWDAGPQDGQVVTSTVSITLMLRNEDPQLRDEAAELLQNIASNALQGQSLAGLTLPDMSRWTGWVWQTATAPERRITATYQYQYISESWAGLGTMP